MGGTRARAGGHGKKEEKSAVVAESIRKGEKPELLRRGGMFTPIKKAHMGRGGGKELSSGGWLPGRAFAYPRKRRGKS